MCNLYREYVVTALAGLAEAGEPLPCAGQQLRRIRAGAEPRDQKEGCRLVCTQRGPAAVHLRWHLDRVQRGARYKVEADPRTAPGLRFPDDLAERRGRTNPPQKAMPTRRGDVPWLHRLASDNPAVYY
jgi:hypothetical protein